MKPLLHPQFKLNGLPFHSPQKLREHAYQLIEKGWDYEGSIGKFILKWLDTNDFIAVQTSGSTGEPKKMDLLKENVHNSASATANYFNLKENSTALLCLSADYIAGKMMLVRAMTIGWNLYCVEPNKEPLKNNKTTFDFAAMVPYQAFHSVNDLKNVRKLIIGGGLVSKILEEELQKVSSSVFVTYGMTETISHIAVRAVNGAEKSMVYLALPKVQFALDERGCLQITAPDITPEAVKTNDMVALLSSTSFKFLGRIDHVINTGGVKINPEMVEAKLSEGIAFPFFIASEKDTALGEKIILIVESGAIQILEDYSEAFSQLSAYEKPKKIYNVPQFIYTDTGKVKRLEVLNLIDL